MVRSYRSARLLAANCVRASSTACILFR
jgi:hypothetical protein